MVRSFLLSGPGPAIQGQSDGEGVVGITGLGDGAGVHGLNSSDHGFGVHGEGGDGVGVEGDAGAGIGVIARTQSTDYAAMYADSAAATSLAFAAVGPNGTCTVDGSGNLACTGTKSAVVPVASGRQVAMYAVESPENWFEDFGSAKLTSGIVTVKLEPTFIQTVNSTEDYHIFLTPNGDCKGLYVSRKTPTSFEVRELGSGQSSVSFGFRIIARRRGYESLRMADVTKKMRRPVFKTKTGQLKKIAIF